MDLDMTEMTAADRHQFIIECSTSSDYRNDGNAKHHNNNLARHTYAYTDTDTSTQSTTRECAQRTVMPGKYEIDFKYSLSTPCHKYVSAIPYVFSVPQYQLYKSLWAVISAMCALHV